jgi:hypothetical protein
MARFYEIHYYDGRMDMGVTELPKLPNFDVKYIKDNFNKVRVPTASGWFQVEEEEALGRTQPRAYQHQ